MTSKREPRAETAAESDADENNHLESDQAQTINLGGFGDSEDDKSYVHLSWVDPRDGKGHRELLVPLTVVFSREFQMKLADMRAPGLTSKDINLLKNAINKASEVTPSTFQVATRIGWIGGRFVLPGRVFGEGSDVRIALDPGGRTERVTRFRCGGTLKGFQKIGKLAHGNSRLRLQMCAAFAGPFIGLLAVEPVMILIVGDPGTGKTTQLIVASSIWGKHIDETIADRLGAVMPLNATLNDLEDELMGARDTFLPLDETRAGAAGALAEFIMRIDSGFEKGRKGSGRTRQAAVAALVASSNKPLDQLAPKGQEVDRAHHDRLIGIPFLNERGEVFDNLHGRRDAKALLADLRALAREHFGLASHLLLERLVKRVRADKGVLVEQLQGWREGFLTAALKLPAPAGQLERVHQRFATLYAAGRFAIEIGLVSWKQGALRKDLLKCLVDHATLCARAELQSRDPLTRLRAYFHERMGEFVDLNKVRDRCKSEAEAKDCVGFLFNHDKRGPEILITEEHAEQIVGGATSLTKLRVALDKLGALAVAGNHRLSVRRPVGKKRDGTPLRLHVLAITRSALETERELKTRIGRLPA
jgi:putative DNA primase/helicase